MIDFSIPILYEDDNFLVINKPGGLVVHADGKTEEPTLVDWILTQYPEMRSIGEPIMLSDGRVIFRPGIVHRIDRDTSGVLLVAKNQTAYEYAKKQFQDRSVRKTYHAFVYGTLKGDKQGADGKWRGRINRPISRSKNDFRQWTAQRGGRGEEREAVTEYEVLKVGKPVSQTQAYSFVEIHPITGRTHQIRVHFKAINHPVVCDSLYASTYECPVELGRMMLHASMLNFVDLKGKSVCVEAPLPAEFEQFLAALS
jgi:23S rRNA pseudouridine1911/1915/1917 synthase